MSAAAWFQLVTMMLPGSDISGKRARWGNMHARQSAVLIDVAGTQTLPAHVCWSMRCTSKTGHE